MCCISGVWATIHTSSWTFLRSLIAQRYAFSSPCAPCVTYFCQFSYQFSLFFIVFVYIEWNKHSLSSPRRGVVPEEWWGPMRRSDDQEIWRNMLEKQALPNFRPSSQFLLVWAYLNSFFGTWGGYLWPRMWCKVYMDTDKEGKHGIDIPWDILG